MTPSTRKLSPLRRFLLLAAAALAVTAILYTLAPAVPRPVDITVRISEVELQDRASTLVITTDGTSVAEAETSPGAIQGGRLTYHFWLAPRPHRLEFRLRGCQPAVRTFNPRDAGTVAFVYRCEG